MNLKLISQNIFQHIRSTLAIQPDDHSLKVSPDRFQSFGYALAGLLHMLRYAKNIRIQVLATAVVIGMSLWLALPRLEIAVLILVIGMNWFAEFVNAAIEAVVNLVTVDYHEMAQLAKDIAAGSVLLMTIVSVIIAALLFIPPLVEKLG